LHKNIVLFSTNIGQLSKMLSYGVFSMMNQRWILIIWIFHTYFRFEPYSIIHSKYTFQWYFYLHDMHLIFIL